MPGETSVTTWNVPFGDIAAPTHGTTSSFWASLISINPTATAFALTCTPGCETFAPTITVGPWAQNTPPPSNGTGIYDIIVPYSWGEVTTTVAETSRGDVIMKTEHTDITTPFEIASWHCDLTGTTELVGCTSMDTSSARGTAYTTFEPFTFAPVSSDWSVTPLTVTITAGVEKIAGTASTTATGSHATGASGTTGSNAAAAGASKTSNAGVPMATGGVGVSGLVGVIAALVLQ